MTDQDALPVYDYQNVNLYKSISQDGVPDVDVFLAYSRIFFNEQQYTNNGKLLRLLEARLAKQHNALQCIVLCNPFWSLILLLDSLGSSEAREVLVPDNSFPLYYEALTWCGKVPRVYSMSDCTPQCVTSELNKHISNHTSYIILPQSVGLNDIEGLSQRIGSSEIPVIVDKSRDIRGPYFNTICSVSGTANCHALVLEDRQEFAQVGYITTDKTELAESLKSRRTFGFTGRDDCTNPRSFNAKLSEVSAALALALLDKIKTVENNGQSERRVRQDFQSSHFTELEPIRG